MHAHGVGDYLTPDYPSVREPISQSKKVNNLDPMVPAPQKRQLPEGPQ